VIRPIVSCALVVLIASAPAGAQLLELPGQTDSVLRLESLDGELELAFQAMLGEYEAEIESRPFDVARRIDRCRFIDEFAYGNEYLSWLDEVYALGDDCRAEVDAGFFNHPEAILFRLEGFYGDDLLEAARPYDQSTLRQGWTRAQTARLYAMLATSADSVGNPLAGPFAVHALELDESADVRVIAAASLIDMGDKAGAIRILRSPFDRHTPGESPWYFADKIRLLALAGDGAGVADLYRQLKESAAYYDTYTVAVALRNTGNIDDAREEFAAAVENPGYLQNPQLERFRFEIVHGTAIQAGEAYESLRDAGWSADPMAVNRVALFFEHPALSWRARDLLGLLGFVLALALVGLAAAIPVSFVHYRGLVLRVRKGLPDATAGLRLRHAWYGMCALGSASLLSLYCAGPLSFFTQQETAWGIDVDSGLFARSFVTQWFIQLALFLPLVWIAVRREPVSARWSVPRALIIASLVAVVLRAPLIIFWLVSSDAPSALGEGSLQWEMLEQVNQEFGVLTTFWLIAIAAPVAEEFLFRQVLLTTFSRHISFWAANVLQAVLFAAMHLDASGLIYIFLMGLVAGFIARRSGGLLAPIVFHAAFNLIAGLLLLP